MEDRLFYYWWRDDAALKEKCMARKGVAILREIAMVSASNVPTAIKVKMMKELNDELESLYAPGDASHQQVLPLAEVSDVKEKRKA